MKWPIEWPSSLNSPYPPRRMSFKGFPILFAQRSAVKIGRGHVHSTGPTNICDFTEGLLGTKETEQDFE